MIRRQSSSFKYEKEVRMDYLDAQPNDKSTNGSSTGAQSSAQSSGMSQCGNALNALMLEDDFMMDEDDDLEMCVDQMCNEQEDDDDESSDDEYVYCEDNIPGFSMLGINNKPKAEGPSWVSDQKKEYKEDDFSPEGETLMRRSNAGIYMQTNTKILYA